MQTTIHRVQPHEAELALELFRWLRDDTEHGHLPPHTLQTAQHTLAQPGLVALVARQQYTLVGGLLAYELPGYASPQPEMMLYDIGVEDHAQRQGIATQLVQALLAICRERGARSLFVLTTSDNLAACRLYEQTGGHPEAVVQFLYSP
jgi:ribosomal protein S18 acetylase RimI-like enzyme